jgi:hypothetical protein
MRVQLLVIILVTLYTLSSPALREYEKDEINSISLEICCRTNIALSECLKRPRVSSGTQQELIWARESYYEGGLRSSASGVPLPAASEHASQTTREDSILNRRHQSTPLAPIPRL